MTRDEHIVSLYQGGFVSAASVARDLEISNTAVYNALRREGITVRRDAIKPKTRRNKAIRKQYEKGVSMAQLGRDNGISRNRVWQIVHGT